ncbi:Cold-shock protein OS=Streptomyces tendae OX=1932 GN=GUR47_20285 PE=4 SV=1 [Streptomyces tendae]
MVQRRKGLRLHRAGRRRPDVFAHYSNINAQGFRELLEGQKVTFDIAQGQKGPTAENITPA